MVDVQNRLKGVEPRLPALVRQGGLSVESATSGFLAIVTLTSEGTRFSALDLEDYLAKNIVPELKRIKGVGRLQSFGTRRRCASGSIRSSSRCWASASRT